MLTTAGMASFAASAYDAAPVGAPAATGGAGAVDCWTVTTLPVPEKRGSRSGRSVATTKRAASTSVQACAKRSQNLRSTGNVPGERRL